MEQGLPVDGWESDGMESVGFILESWGKNSSSEGGEKQEMS